jgi:hypothetical protein
VRIGFVAQHCVDAVSLLEPIDRAVIGAAGHFLKRQSLTAALSFRTRGAGAPIMLGF